MLYKLIVALSILGIVVACQSTPHTAHVELEIPKIPSAPAPVKSASVRVESAPVLSAASASGSVGAAATKVVKIPYRRFLTPIKMSTVLKDGETKSFVVFTHRPTLAADVAIYQQVCRQWFDDFEGYEAALAASAAVPNAKLMPFYWPTTTNMVTALGCNDLYDYDYAFASAIVALIGPAAQSVGPLLVLQQGNEWMLLDISKFEPVDVQRAFVVWKRQIVAENPVGVRFTMVKFREYFRTLVNQYGESIAKYVKVS